MLGLLFGQPDRSFYANEIAKLALTGRGALQRELERMTSSGLITMTPIGRQKHYQANRKSPMGVMVISPEEVIRSSSRCSVNWNE